MATYQHEVNRAQFLTEKKSNDPRRYYPADGLNRSSIFVVRTENIKKFLSQISESDMTDSNLPSPLSMTVNMPDESILLSLDEWVALLVERSSDKNRMSWRMWLENSLSGSTPKIVARFEGGRSVPNRTAHEGSTCWLKSEEVGQLLSADGYDVSFQGDQSNGGARAPGQPANPVLAEQSAAAGNSLPMKKQALIDACQAIWPTIRSDIAKASTNDLNFAKIGTRDWDKAKALEWASARGRLKSDTPHKQLSDALTSAVSNS